MRVVGCFDSGGSSVKFAAGFCCPADDRSVSQQDCAAGRGCCDLLDDCDLSGGRPSGDEVFDCARCVGLVR